MGMQWEALLWVSAYMGIIFLFTGIVFLVAYLLSKLC